MENVASVLRGIHIVAAILSLLLLGVPLVAKKGAKLHKRIGWAWVVVMAFVVVTGTAIALLTIAWPAAMRPGVSAERARTFGLFLLLVGAMTASSVWQGIRAIGRKYAPSASRHPFDRGLPAAALALAIFVTVLGLARGSILFSVFGLGAATLTAGHLRFAWRPLLPSKMAWWYGHMSGMLTAVIAALTAFAVSGLQRFVTVPATLAFLPWIAPGLLLAPVLAFWQRYYRKRFEPAARSRDGGGEELA
jgi:hypothetical protein